MHFGKYTLFSTYGTTANGSMFPIAFGIIFCNENKECWKKFWNFVGHYHPKLNSPDVMIITDQDKGSMAAIADKMSDAHHLHCSWHRTGNIIGACRMGKKIYCGYWYFKQLVDCDTIDISAQQDT